MFPFPSKSLSVPWFPKSRMDVIAGFHSGVDSLVYGYSGFAEIGYALEIDSGLLEVEFVLSSSGNIKVRVGGEELSLDDYLKKVLSRLNVSVDALDKYSFYLGSRTEFVDELHEFLCRIDVWNDLVKRGANTRLIKGLVNKAARDEFTEILLRPKNRLMLRKELSNGNVMYIDVADLGDGIERALIVALALEYLSPKLVLIDDVEQSAHYGLIKAFMEWLASRDWQVVMTTHSVDVLSVLSELDIEGFQLIALNKNPDDFVRFRIYSLDELKDAIESGIDPRKLLDLV